jgi:hypothetical protein
MRWSEFCNGRSVGANGPDGARRAGPEVGVSPKQLNSTQIFLVEKSVTPDEEFSATGDSEVVLDLLGGVFGYPRNAAKFPLMKMKISCSRCTSGSVSAEMSCAPSRGALLVVFVGEHRAVADDALHVCRILHPALNTVGGEANMITSTARGHEKTRKGNTVQ